MMEDLGDLGPTDVPPDFDEVMFDGEPIPLTRRHPVPPFPMECLPPAIAAMVSAVAVATQTDPAMVGTVALSVLSACTGGHAEIEVRPGWIEALHAYFLIIARSGERKSAVQSEMTRPLLTAEQQLIRATSGRRQEAEIRRQVAEQAAEASRRNAARAAGTDGAGDALAAAFAAAELAQAIDVPVIPRLIADDITPEAAATLLAEQNGRLAIISAEGGLFDIIAGRYNGNVPNLDLWLKGHSGDPVRVDRKGRAPEHIPRPALTLGLMIQPLVLSSLVAKPQFRGRGLLARMLYAYPVSKVGRRDIAPPPVDPEIAEAYRNTIVSLVSGLAEWSGDPAILVLSPGAQQEMLAQAAAVEPTLAGDGELATLADWGSKFTGAVARIAGMLHLAEHGATEGPPLPVAEATVARARRIGEYFRACAINAFAEMRADPVVADAVYLLGRVVSLSDAEISERDLFTACSRGRFPKVGDMTPPLHRLIEHGYLVAMPTAKPTGGRPASRRFRVHPRAAEAAKAAEA